MLICNMYTKYKSSKDFKRRDARISAQVVSSLLFQFFDKKHVYMQQFRECLYDIVHFYGQFKKNYTLTPNDPMT